MNAPSRSLSERAEWEIIVSFLRRTDHHQLVRLSRRMINYLAWSGVGEAQELLRVFAPARRGVGVVGEENRPTEKKSQASLLATTDETFRIAASHLEAAEILAFLQQWIRDEKSGFLIEAVEDLGTSVGEIAMALERTEDMAIQDADLSRAIREGLRVALVRRFLTEELVFINVAKSYVEVGDFYDLVRHVISPPGSHGKLGGKGAGLFLAARILEKSPEVAETIGTIRTPKTWYVTSDGVVDFIQYNDLQDIYNRKYMDIEQVREEYPHIVQVFKNSHLSPEIVKGLSVALDDFEDRPVIVRSSSLLEDRLGAAFSGKYKSLFLANQGSKRERLTALMDAISEVYASVFSPDPIEYRSERGLLDVHEEMGILLQEVVGTRVGKYFLPTFAGVAFSNNEFRWSSRIRRSDGLVRLVPGLGTRAVDRVGDDYPVLVAPGQPGLRVNVTREEVVRYAPRNLDVINLESRSFETVPVTAFLAECGSELPGVRNVVSVVDHDGLHRPYLLDIEAEAEKLVVTFEPLIETSPFVAQMRTILGVLREKIGRPVDIEFASDGKDLYLLQCRPQSFSDDAVASPIPRDVPAERVVFTAHRYVSNGRVPDITHIVYVDPEGYDHLPNVEALRRVGRAVGRLNKVLPKRQFVLIGPGRWGSRGDVKLGVPVGYSDINNTAVLLEVARKRGNYVPDLSFGTHFFQDLVEARIRYVPLFPDEPGVVFNERFLRDSPNALAEVLPEFADLAPVVRVIDVPAVTGGLVLRVLLNADLDEAAGVLARPVGAGSIAAAPSSDVSVPVHRAGDIGPDEPCRWRLRMAERIAADVDAARFGVKGVYLHGSVKAGTAGATSDIDLIFHVADPGSARQDLGIWLDGWSRCLSEVNWLRTGFRVPRMLNVDFVTDEDIASEIGRAAKVRSATNPARPLPVGACSD